MKKLLTGILTITALFIGLCETWALTSFTTYNNYPVQNGTIRTISPNVTNRYDANGRRIGTYVTNPLGITRSYDQYGRQNGVYIPTNRNINRSYYNRYNPNYYNYNGGFGGLKSYNRFGRRIR